MRGIIYASEAEALDAQAALDAAHGYPRTHAAGAGEHDFRIDRPGRAAQRLRDRGIRTTHHAAIVAHPMTAEHALLVEDPAAVNLPESWYQQPPR